jgi:hypothetical protein
LSQIKMTFATAFDFSGGRSGQKSCDSGLAGSCVMVGRKGGQRLLRAVLMRLSVAGVAAANGSRIGW